MIEKVRRTLDKVIETSYLSDAEVLKLSEELMSEASIFDYKEIKGTD